MSSDHRSSSGDTSYQQILMRQSQKKSATLIRGTNVLCGFLHCTNEVLYFFKGIFVECIVHPSSFRTVANKPGLFQHLRWNDRRDCAVLSSSVNSQTHCSPSRSRFRMSNRVSSESAWYNSAARVKFADKVVAMMEEISINFD